MDGEFAFEKNQIADGVTIGPEFQLDFEIKLTGTNAAWTNVMMFTAVGAGNGHGKRIPGIFIIPVRVLYCQKILFFLHFYYFFSFGKYLTFQRTSNATYMLFD